MAVVISARDYARLCGEAPLLAPRVAEFRSQYLTEDLGHLFDDLRDHGPGRDVEIER